MAVKRGPPPPGEHRRLTKGEAAAVGCAETWHVISRPDGIWLMKPWRRREWVGPGPRLQVVSMTAPALANIRGQLRRYWNGRRVTLSPEEASRMLALVNDVPRGITTRVKGELEWAAGVLNR